MKRLVLCLLLAALLAGCGGPVSSAAPSGPAASSAPHSESAPASFVQIESEPASSQPESLPPEGYLPGSWDGDVYTSNQLGFTFQLPEGWQHAEPDELFAMSGYDAAGRTPAQQSQDLAALPLVYELLCSDPDSGAFITVSSTDLSAPEYEGVATAEDLLQRKKDELLFEEPDAQFEPVYEIRLAGRSYQRLPCTAGGYQQDHYVSVQDGAAVCITLVYPQNRQHLAQTVISQVRAPE